MELNADDVLHRLAVHEAGHAVMALYLERPVRHLVVSTGAPSYVAGVDEDGATSRTKEQVRRTAGAIAMAGYHAVRTILGDAAADEQLAESDQSHEHHDYTVADVFAGEIASAVGGSAAEVRTSFLAEASEVLAIPEAQWAVARLAVAAIVAPGHHLASDQILAMVYEPETTDAPAPDTPFHDLEATNLIDLTHTMFASGLPASWSLSLELMRRFEGCVANEALPGEA